MKHLNILFILSLFTCMASLHAACRKTNPENNVKQASGLYEITKPSIQKHILYLASDKLKGRAVGSPETKLAIDYITGQYDSAGLHPVDSSYLQVFETMSRFSSSSSKIKGYNVIGLLEGADSLLKKEYIILGAHFDHIGMARDTNAVYNGADDNASGIAVMLEVAKKLNSVKDSLKRSILFIAFDAEEIGLRGSAHFVSDPVVPFGQIKLMMNLDMMGRIAAGDSLAVSGGGSFQNGNDILNLFSDTTSTHVYTSDRLSFNSDHAPFFSRGIPIIYPTPKLHPDYHSYRDDEHLINYDGAKNICDYTFHVLSMMANKDSIIATIENRN